MDLTSLLTSALSSASVEKIAWSVGIKNKQAQWLIAAAVPMLLKQLNKNASDSKWANDLNTALDKHTGGFGDIIWLLTGDGQADGQKALWHILDDKTETTQELSKQTGISNDKTSQILGALAPLLLKWLSQAKQSEWLDTDGLQKLLDSTAKQAEDGNMIDSLLTMAFDKNKDGLYKDDLMTMWMDWIKSHLATNK